jgi:hypothetical protein
MRPIIVESEYDSQRRKFYQAIFLFFVKWIVTIITLGLFFSGKLIHLLKDSGFIAAIYTLMLLGIFWYSWYVDIGLFLKRRRQNKRLITDPLIVELIIILVLIVLIAWNFFPEIFQGDNAVIPILVIFVGSLLGYKIYKNFKKKAKHQKGKGKPRPKGRGKKRTKRKQFLAYCKRCHRKRLFREGKKRLFSCVRCGWRKPRRRR